MSCQGPGQDSRGMELKYSSCHAGDWPHPAMVDSPDCVILILTHMLPSWPGISPSPQLPSRPRFVSDPNSTLTGPDPYPSIGLNLPCPQAGALCLVWGCLRKPALLPTIVLTPLVLFPKKTIYGYLLCQKLRTCFSE